MQCFAPQEQGAVGVRKCCAKGVCAACAISVTNRLACSASCAPVAESLSQPQLTTIRDTNIHRSHRFVQPIAVLAFVAIGASLLHSQSTHSMGWIMVAMGGLMGLPLLVSSVRKR